jgi:hypothetical protein
MRRTKRTTKKRVVRNWREARALLERWRKNLINVEVELKQPRVTDVVPVDLLREEAVESEREPKQKFRGQVIYFTRADVTIRRPSGAILVIDTYELVAISDAKTRFESP